MRQIDYLVWREDEFFVAQSLSFDVSSFGDSRKEVVENLQEAVDLLLADEP